MFKNLSLEIHTYFYLAHLLFSYKNVVSFANDENNLKMKRKSEISAMKKTKGRTRPTPMIVAGRDEQGQRGSLKL